MSLILANSPFNNNSDSDSALRFHHQSDLDILYPPTDLSPLYNFRPSPHDVLEEYARDTFLNQESPSFASNSLKRSSSGLKRSFQSMQESDPFTFLLKKNYFYVVSAGRELYGMLNNAVNLNDILIVFHKLNEMDLSLKEEHLSNKFKEDLNSKLRSLTEEHLNFSEATYQDLQRLRQAKRTLDLLDRLYGHTSIKDDIQLKEILAPFKAAIEGKLSTLYHSKKGITTRLAEKLIAQMRGKQTRDMMVTIDQVHSLIKDEILEAKPEDLLDISRAFARQINEIMENRDQYKGKSIRLHPNEKKYLFHDFDKKEPQELSLNYNCWLQLSNDEEQIELFIAPYCLKKLGSGGFKTVYKGQSYNFKLKAEYATTLGLPDSLNKPIARTYTRKGSYTPVALHRIKNRMGVATIDRGIALQKELIEQAPLAKIASLPIKLNPSTTDSEVVIYTQDWYNSDLKAASKTFSIPLDFNEPPRNLKLFNFDLLKIVRDVGVAICQSHKVGIIHKDLKPNNIFLKLSENKKTIQGFPADYDLSRRQGPEPSDPEDKFYSYWDTLSNKGVVTPFVDVYGLALSLFESVIPGFKYADIKNMINQDVQEAYILNIINKILDRENHPLEGSIAETIKANEDRLEAAIAAGGPGKKLLQIAKNNICALKRTLSLFVKVINIDKKLSESYSGKIGPVWNSFVSHEILSSQEKRNSTIIQELELEHTFMDFSSNIPNFNTLDNNNKIKTLKSLIWKEISNNSIASNKKEELRSFLLKIQIRQDVLTFMSRMTNLTDDNRSKHPLLNSLNNPMQLVDQKIIDQRINDEIKQMELLENSPLGMRAKKAFEKFNSSGEERNAFKILLQNMISNKHELEFIKENASYILDQIILIENAMAYAVYIRDEFLWQSSKASKIAMSMEEFVAHLDSIIHELNPNFLLSPNA